MTLQQWVDFGWLERHLTSRQEIGNLLSIVDRDLDDAQGDISVDWKFGIAYNAALKLCTILLYANGYRAKRNEHHFRTLKSLAVTLGDTRRGDADYLEACRVKRNTVEYDYAGGVTESEAEELFRFAVEMRSEVIDWLTLEHSELVSQVIGSLPDSENPHSLTPTHLG